MVAWGRAVLILDYVKVEIQVLIQVAGPFDSDFDPRSNLKLTAFLQCISICYMLMLTAAACLFEDPSIKGLWSWTGNNKVN